MSTETLRSLAVITLVGVGAVVLVDRFPRLRLNVVVLELLGGIVIGPAVLHVAVITDSVHSFAELGLAFLMFTAGYVLEFSEIRGRPITTAALGWGVSLLLGLGIGYTLEARGAVLDGLVTGLALTTTALGTLLPMWRDSGFLASASGRYAMAVGCVGEFGPILAIAVLLGTNTPGKVTLLLIAFVAAALATAALASRARTPRSIEVLRRHFTTTAQLPVRVAVLLVIVLLWIASELGLDVLLGAFTAGLIVKMAANGPDEAHLRSKLDAIGFGFLIPIFFVVSGMGFDLHALIDSPGYLADIPLFLACFVIVRGLPTYVLAGRSLERRARRASVLFAATALPLVVVITQIGVQTGHMRRPVASALVAAAMLSVVVFPPVAFSLLGLDPGAAGARAGRAARTRQATLRPREEP